jgi:hypothetical protein
MRPHLLILMLFIASLLALTQLTAAQEGPVADEESGRGQIAIPPITDSSEITIWQTTEAGISTELILQPMAEAAADLCSLATPLILTPLTVPASSQANIATFTNDLDDPPLSCMWGSNPPSTTGYRTAWYQFTPVYNGQVTITTETSEYDTILGVFTGACGAANLLPVACNDDATGFTSEVGFAVQRGVTYYVLLADWQPGAASNPLLLNLQASYDTPLVTNWTTVGVINEPRTRHATAVLDQHIYVLGGLTSGNTMSNRLFRYNANTNQTVELASSPFTPGIMNTTAVLLSYTVNNNLRREIFVPGGTIGASDTANTNEHWVYNLPANSWTSRFVADVPLGGGAPFAYAAAATIDTGDGYYLMGGVAGPGWPVTAVLTDTIRDNVLFYNARTDTWSDAYPPMGSARYGHTAAAFGGRICVAGGLAFNENDDMAFANPVAECANRANPAFWTPTAPMNVPRYFAHSAVGPDGRWYIYGGIDGQGNPVPEVELYDPAFNAWFLLHHDFDLNGRRPAEPPIVWPRGGFVGGQLWALGGHFLVNSTQQLNPDIKRMTRPQRGSLFLPLVIGNPLENYTLATARPLTFGQPIIQRIELAQHRYRFYEVVLTQRNNLRLNLTVPGMEDMDLYLYNGNKRILARSDSPFPGADESICLSNLPAGRYFVAVRHQYPINPTPGLDFQIIARRVTSCS